MVDTLKSTSITNLDASPPTANTAGQGGPGNSQDASDWVSATAAGLGSTSSTYKLVRLPSNCVVKAMRLTSKTQLDSGSALTVDVGAYYSDSTIDGTQGSNQGNSISVNAFLANTAFGQVSGYNDIDALQAFDVDKRNQELWNALAIATDPGGFIDVVVAVHTGAGTGIAGKIGLSVKFVIP